jgi:hypothetical protein
MVVSQVNWGRMGFESITSATVIAATVWGRDEDGFQFKQHDIDKLLSTVDHRGLRATFTINLYPMRTCSGQYIFSSKSLNLSLYLDPFVTVYCPGQVAATCRGC